MEKLKHPTKEEIYQYIWQELAFGREIEVSEHLAICRQCTAFSRQEYQMKFLWENWTAKSHGKIYWQNRIKEVLEGCRETAPSFALKERLAAWLEEYKAKVGGIAEVILERTKELGKVITDLPQALLAPQALEFIQVVAVRGEGEKPEEIKIVNKGELKVQVITDTAKRFVTVQIPQSERKPPLVILSPQKGKPLLAEPQKVKGTNFYAACFKDIPPGEYMLIFEPEITQKK